MTSWDMETVQRYMDEFLGVGDPSDPKERKRKRILQAATKLFIRHGYRRTSIDQVARGAGVAKGTIYLYFKTKSDLLIHAIGEEKKRYFSNMKAFFDPDLPARDRLKMYVKTALVLSTEMPLVSKLLGGDREILAVLDDMDADMGKEFEMMRFDFLGEIIGEAAGDHRWTDMELRDRVTVIYGLVYFGGILTDERIRGSLSVSRFAELLANMLVDGIGVSKHEEDPSSS